ncbi:MAG: glucose-1-phosphate adenylyltransferase [Methylococcaceae bacterium]|nr:glucose-1-phosphate adenylyltransferase [Methylococcaceae bacterium]MDD1609228.1 glucose-1-phosphate adenylyltransferase [Methylococcaceae bacterium]MDD1615146.1 glucose-1-phosphate adenylyltransferase [Methylococcaceae bacterium]OYV21061.1 MAG: glucose-1-phosphate adenylyltransferase [Methylococcaceae bacterium NSP1-2]
MSESNNNKNDRIVSHLTRNTIALILAGGRGSRLMDMTDWRAKPAVPFGGKFRIIDFPLSNCVNSGIRKIGILTQYKADSLIRHIQQGWGFLRGEFGEYVDLMPAQQRVDEDSWYKGTADAIFQNIDILRSRSPEHILVLAGDHIYKMDYGEMLADHIAKNADLTIGCIEVSLEEATAFGVMDVDDNRRVKAFVEKPEHPPIMPGRTDTALASMGIYIFNAGFLFEQLIKDADTKDSSHDFGKDIIPSVIDKYIVNAYPFLNLQGGQSYWRDVGTIDAYWSANMELVSVKPDLNLYDKTWPIWTYQAQTPPAKFVFDNNDRRGQAVDSMVSGGCVISGANVRRSLLFSNVRVNSYTTITDSIVLPDVNIARNCRITKAIIERGCEVPEGMVIGENRADDEKRFHVSAGGVVLVTSEMLGQHLHYVR